MSKESKKTNIGFTRKQMLHLANALIKAKGCANESKNPDVVALMPMFKVAGKLGSDIMFQLNHEEEQKHIYLVSYSFQTLCIIYKTLSFYEHSNPDAVHLLALMHPLIFKSLENALYE